MHTAEDATDVQIALNLLPNLFALRGLAQEVGPGDPRLDQVDSDAERLDLVREAFGQALDGELAGGIDGGALACQDASTAGHMDNDAGVLRPHVRQHGLGEVGQPKEVDVELVPGVRLGDFLQGPHEPEAGVVDEDVDAPVPSHGGIDGGGDSRGSPCDFDLDEVRLGVIFQRLGKFGGAARCGNYGMAMREKELGEEQAKPRVSACDEPDGLCGGHVRVKLFCVKLY